MQFVIFLKNIFKAIFQKDAHTSGPPLGGTSGRTEWMASKRPLFIHNTWVSESNFKCLHMGPSF